MKKYILKRVLISAVTLFVILLILFTMLEFMPGSPFNDEKITPAQMELLKETYGLNDPFPVKFFRYVWNVCKGNFGISYNIQANMPVTQLLAGRLPLSMRIGGQAAVFGITLGLLLGIMAALNRNTAIDSLATTVSVVGISLPNFVFALFLSYVFAFRLKWVSVLYTNKAPVTSTILPSIALAMFTIASIARYSRSELIEVMGSDYILLADSKGLSRGTIIRRHALRNAMIGVITVMGPLIVNLLTGSLVIEKAFSIPGIGSMFVTAIQSNDYNVVLSISFIYSLLYIVMMLIVDILYGVIDPRIRLSKEG